MNAPENIQRAVVGCVLLAAHDNEKAPERIVDIAQSIIKTDDLTDPFSHKAIQAIFELYDEGRRIDLVTLAARLTIEKNEQSVIFELQKAMDFVPSPDLVVSYCEIIKEASDRRKLMALLEKKRSEFVKETKTAPATLARQFEDELSSLFDDGNKPHNEEAIALTQALANNLDYIDKMYHRVDKSLPTGLTTGFRDLDDELAGLHDGDLIIVAGRPSMGKTSLAMQIATNSAMGSNRAAVAFSLEMPADALSMRLLGAHSNVGLQALRKGTLEESDFTKIQRGVETLTEVPLYIEEASAISPAEIKVRLKKLVRQGIQIGLVVIDYIQLMVSGHNHKNREQEIASISRDLKRIAKEFKIPVVALSQLNRSLESRANKRPVMSDLRESGAIEQDADVILFIYRDKVYNPDTTDTHCAEVIIGKQRNGPIGTVRLHYEERNSQFGDYLFAH